MKYAPVLFISRLPFRVLYRLSDISFVVIYYLLRYRRGLVRRNLIASFPQKALQEIVHIEKAFYRHFTDLIFETAKFITISRNEIKDRLTVENPEVLDKFFKEKRSVIVYTAHLGNWEWMAAIPLILPHKSITFYQPLQSAYFEKLMKTTRERFGAMAVPSKKGYKTMMEVNDSGTLTATCVIGDQRPKKRSSIHWTHFLHQETAFLIGADRMARKANQPVIFPHMRKTGRGHYRLKWVTLTEHPRDIAPEEIIELYAQALEAAIAEAPHTWLWSHDRWKTKKQVG